MYSGRGKEFDKGVKTHMRLNMQSYNPEGEVIKEEEKENPTFVQFMKRIDQLPEVTREAIKNCGNDPAIAKAALEISGIDK